MPLVSKKTVFTPVNTFPITVDHATSRYFMLAH